jgi:hypothetical protein
MIHGDNVYNIVQFLCFSSSINETINDDISHDKSDVAILIEHAPNKDIHSPSGRVVMDPLIYKE